MTLGSSPCREALRRSVIGESWLTNADAKRVNVLVRFEISPLRRSAHLPGAVVPPDDNPDRAGEPRLLVHVGAAHARPAGTRGVASPARARRQSRKSRPRAGTPEWGLPQPWSAGSGPAGRRAGQPGDWPPVPRLALVPTADPEGSCGTRPGGDLTGPTRSCRGRLGAQAQWRPMRDSPKGDARGPPGSLRPALAAADAWRSSAEPPLH